jgi:porin
MLQTLLLRTRPARIALATLLVAGLPARAAAADGALAIEASWDQDAVAVVADGRSRLRDSTLLRINADLALDQAMGWHGATLHVQAIATAGSHPGDAAATLQGIDNIEVANNRFKLLEAWLEQAFAHDRLSLRLGFSDLNAEFYLTDSSAGLIAPAFGIGSELAATGPNGPSLFPSTALTARLRADLGKGRYAQAAVVNAEAGVLGDHHGVRPLLAKGALLIGEAGIAGKGKLAAGLWAYTNRQPEFPPSAFATPAGRRAWGGYVLGEAPLTGSATLFARAGASDGRTTPFHGGWQAGVRIAPVWAGRPQGRLSLGANQAFVTQRYRAAQGDPALRHRRVETGFEATYADAVAPWLTLQPDIQYVLRGEHAPRHRGALVLGLRMTVTASRETAR